VLDASAALELLFRTPAGQAVADRIARGRPTLHAPHLLDLEVIQAVRRYERTGVIDAERARQALEDFSLLELTRHAHDFMWHRIWELRANLTAYDAAYVVLAEALPAPLLTADSRISRASGHRARVELVP
jgi:predicted nucleic acid-binding protein